MGIKMYFVKPKYKLILDNSVQNFFNAIELNFKNIIVLETIYFLVASLT